MIFSRQQLETAMAHVTTYINKVLLINIEENAFKPIKVDAKEWGYIDSTMSFTDWVEGFAKEPYYIKDDDILILTRLYYLKTLNHPIGLKYKKLVKGEYHDMHLEFYPIGSGLAYIFVWDLTVMKGE